jgi:hypothetical protein
MRTLKEITDIGVRALVDALGKEDAQRFLAQFRASSAATAGSGEPGDPKELPPLTVEESHNTVRDMHDPMEQQHLL